LESFSVLRELDASWKDHFAQEPNYRSYSQEDQERRQYFWDSLVCEASLQQHIIDQLKLVDASDDEKRAMVYLLGSLDDRGFLTSTVQDIALSLQMPQASVERARKALQTLDPTGLGSTDLQDCLLCQLEQKNLQHTLAGTIVRQHFDLFLRRRIPELARKTGVRIEAVNHALADIAKLDPFPGLRFSQDSNRSIQPDVTVLRESSGEWTLSLSREHLPRLRIHPWYKALMQKETLTGQERDYLKTKLQSGRFLIQAIEQRQDTLERIAREILDLQKPFFEQGTTHLKPLTMNAVAERVGLHETTISRAIANKYIRTPHGIFELRYFFTSGYTSQKSGQLIANTSVKEAIAKLVDAEPPHKPYSDQAIADLLAKQGIVLARRTVTKYREELKIAPTHLRKQYSR
jgi:RNA polymerase sigma-54 factor